jgi:hypothetical protein
MELLAFGKEKKFNGIISLISLYLRAIASGNPQAYFAQPLFLENISS